MTRKIIFAGSLVLMLGVWSSQAAVTFQFNYTDSGTGFDDPTHGAARQAELGRAASQIADLFVHYNATIQLDVDGSITEDGVLASAGSNYNSPYPGAGFGDQGDVMVKILGGADPAPGTADGEVSWNFEDQTWALGDTVGAGEFDFLSTAKHELLHAVGFLSGINGDGSDAWGNVAGTAGVWSPFDEFVADQIGYLIDGSFALDGDAWDTASVGGSGEDGLMFIGPNAMAANGGNPIYLYSPTPWEDGSSGSHLDDDVYGGTYIMEAAAGTGLSTRGISAVELGILRDIGYTNAIPEPGLLVFMGLPWIVFAALRRKTQKNRS